MTVHYSVRRTVIMELSIHYFGHCCYVFRTSFYFTETLMANVEDDYREMEKAVAHLLWERDSHTMAHC